MNTQCSSQKQLSLSVVIAVYNGASTLRRCLDSVLAQRDTALELIVIDGGSTDGSVDVLGDYGDRIAYRLSEPDDGVYDAWNKGIRHARGAWIIFLGADDYFWSDDALRQLMSQVTGDAPRVIYGGVGVVNGQGDLLYRAGQDWSIAKRRFRDHMSIPHQGVLHHRSLFETHGEFDTRFRIAGDYELLLRELKDGHARYMPMPHILVAMQAGGLSSRPDNALTLLAEYRQAQVRHGYRLPSPYWLAAMTRIYLRQMLSRLFGDRCMRIMLDWGRKLMGKRAYWTRT